MRVYQFLQTQTDTLVEVVASGAPAAVKFVNLAAGQPYSDRLLNHYVGQREVTLGETFEETPCFLGGC